MKPLVNFVGGLLTLLRGRSLSILIYHRVLEKPDYMRPDEPTTFQFDWQMGLIKRYFHPLSLQDAVAKLGENRLPRNAVCITFDDGYADNLTLAAPILARYEVPATVFVAPGFLNGGIMWNDKIIESVRTASENQLDLQDLGLGSYHIESEEQRKQAAYDLIGKLKYRNLIERQDLVDKIATYTGFQAPDLMMTDDQVVELRKKGIDIGAHTMTHPILTRVELGAAEQEILFSKEYLENLLQQPITQFAYPNGRYGEDYSDDHRRLVENLGFDLSVSTNLGVNRYNQNRYELRRFTPWDKRPEKFLLRLYLNSL